VAFDKSLVEEVLHQADVVEVISSYINVIKKGRNYVAVCPFHDDKNPSLMISKEKQIFKCFVCGHGGTAISFVQDYEKIAFGDAIRKVANLVGFSDPRLMENRRVVAVDEALQPLYKCINDLTLYYQYGLSTPEGKAGLDYLNSRSLDESLRNKYQLGYALQDGKGTIQYLTAKGHSLKTIENIGIAGLGSFAGFSDRNAGRVMFPIADANGQVVGFSARRIVDNDEAKYINSPETKIFHKATLLYNYHNALRTARHDGYVYVLEGFMDVYALSRVGIESAVALMGTNLSKEHLVMLRKTGAEIRLCLDGDNAGQSAMMKIFKQLDDEHLKYRIVSNQNDERDPDEILQEEGPEALKKYMNNLIDRAEFALNYYKQTNALKTLEERKKLVTDFIPLLVSTTNRLELEDYILNLAKSSGFTVETIKDLVRENQAKEEKGNDHVIAQFHPERKTLRKFQLAEREVLFQMLRNPAAVDFYQAKIEYFYDELYRNIANFIVEYKSKNEKIEIPTLLTELAQSEVDPKGQMQNEITTISLENFHPECTDTLLEECHQVIVEERQDLYDKEVLEKSLVGKTDIEKARIIAAYNKKKFKKDITVNVAKNK